MSVSRAIAVNFVFAAFLGGIGGALTVLALGHIEPNFSYWTTSGEFVFVAILAGHHSMLAVFLASFVVEVVRSFVGASVVRRVVLLGDTNKVWYTRCIGLKMSFNSPSRPHWGQ